MDLPNEILLIIFSYLSFEEMFKGPWKVCKRWRNLTRYPSSLDLSWLGRTHNPKAILKLLDKQKTNQIILQHCYLNEVICSKIIKKFTFCKKLSLKKMYAPWSSFLCIPHLTRLKVFEVEDNYVFSNFHLIFITSSCVEIETINLINCRNISDYGLVLLGQNCKKLKEIDISYNQKITLLAVDLLIQDCKDLRKITLVGTKLKICDEFRESFKNIKFVN